MKASFFYVFLALEREEFICLSDIADIEKYNEKKLSNQELPPLIEKYVSITTYFRIKNCASFLHFVADGELKKHALYRLNGCGNRYCPMCNWRKSKKVGFMIDTISKYVTFKDEQNKSLIFLTLTIPNVKEDELEEAIVEYNKAFKRLMQRKEVKRAVKGYVRKLEVTYNKVRDDYHPHFHIMIAVNKSYFTDPNYYITRDRWLKLWQESTRNPLITQVDVRSPKDLKKAIRELTKYIAKDSEYLSTQEVFDVFYDSLYNKRDIVYSGLFKEGKKLYEDGKLDHLKDKDDTVFEYEVFNAWTKKKKYEEVDVFPITQEVSDAVNN